MALDIDGLNLIDQSAVCYLCLPSMVWLRCVGEESSIRMQPEQEERSLRQSSFHPLSDLHNRDYQSYSYASREFWNTVRAGALF